MAIVLPPMLKSSDVASKKAFTTRIFAFPPLLLLLLLLQPVRASATRHNVASRVRGNDMSISGAVEGTALQVAENDRELYGKCCERGCPQ